MSQPTRSKLIALTDHRGVITTYKFDERCINLNRDVRRRHKTAPNAAVTGWFVTLAWLWATAERNARKSVIGQGFRPDGTAALLAGKTLMIRRCWTLKSFRMLVTVLDIWPSRTALDPARGLRCDGRFDRAATQLMQPTPEDRVQQQCCGGNDAAFR